jgi:hypothetical protein
MRLVIAVVLTLLFSASLKAQGAEELSSTAGPNSGESAASLPDPAPQAHPGAITYSEAYQTRLKIHKYASFATLPLFAAEVALGESLYNNPGETGSKKGLHAVVGTGIVGLFGVNTVTGAWNMWEGRHDPNGRKLKLAHGILMMVADAGFAATVFTAPSTHHGVVDVIQTNRVAHRDIALGSVAVATVGYLMMLFGGH